MRIHIHWRKRRQRCGDELRPPVRQHQERKLADITKQGREERVREGAPSPTTLDTHLLPIARGYEDDEEKEKGREGGVTYQLDGRPDGKHGEENGEADKLPRRWRTRFRGRLMDSGGLGGLRLPP
ncbi:hypothetical protein R1sor_009769 [Riccia sorocarpa]|uniref:Uncharacterized protein n=1 Tax=Riccia sorocarpa TaxID=122646 RepID=A0ABD3HWB9_9MARC